VVKVRPNDQVELVVSVELGGTLGVVSSAHSPQKGPSTMLLGLGSFVFGQPDPINILVVKTVPDEERRWPHAQRLLSKLVVPTKAIEMSMAELTSQEEISLRNDAAPKKIALKVLAFCVFHPETSELKEAACLNVDSNVTTFSVFHLLRSPLKLVDS